MGEIFAILKTPILKESTQLKKIKTKIFQKNTFKQLRKLKKECKFIFSFLLDEDNDALKHL